MIRVMSVGGIDDKSRKGKSMREKMGEKSSGRGSIVRSSGTCEEGEYEISKRF